MDDLADAAAAARFPPQLSMVTGRQIAGVPLEVLERGHGLVINEGMPHALLSLRQAYGNIS